MTKLTCITTVYNDGPDLMCSVKSVLNQTRGDVEYILLDDGSDAATRDILAGLDDPRITLLTQANDGLSSARNRALEHATGDYVCFLDADDLRAPWSFAAILDQIDAHTPDVILCRGLLSEIRGDLIPFYDTHLFEQIDGALGDSAVTRDMAQAATVWPMAQMIEPQSANKVVRRQMLRDHHIGFPNGHFFEDIYFHSLILAHAGSLAFVQSPSFTYFRRYRRAQITGAAGTMRFDILAVAKLTLERFARCPDFHDPIRRTAMLAAAAKIIQWCEDSIGHAHRAEFRDVARGLTRLIDPLYFHSPDPLPAPLAGPLGHVGYLRELFDADA